MSSRDRTALAGSATASRRPAVRALIVLAVPPALWFAHLNVSYVLVPPSCSWEQRWTFALVTVVALVAMAPSAVASWRAWHAADGDDGALVRFLGGTGLAMVGVFALVTLLVGASAVVISPCQ
jgi:phosphoglycerol transferase MdoB-like AlkP superfamily enzyme